MILFVMRPKNVLYFNRYLKYIRPVDHDVLVSFFDNCNGELWKNSTGWKTNTSICNWNGVMCNERNDVVEL
jgi:hypothetical protein